MLEYRSPGSEKNGQPGSGSSSSSSSPPGHWRRVPQSNPPPPGARIFQDSLSFGSRVYPDAASRYEDRNYADPRVYAESRSAYADANRSYADSRLQHGDSRTSKYDDKASRVRRSRSLQLPERRSPNPPAPSPQPEPPRVTAGGKRPPLYTSKYNYGHQIIVSSVRKKIS